MAQDATGTPTTNYSIPKFNTAADAPTGKGVNAMMDSIDTLLKNSFAAAPAGIATGEAMVWNGTTWARSSATRLTTVRPQDLGQDAAVTGQVMVWDGSKWAPGSALNYDTSWSSDTPVTIANTVSETLLIDMTVTAATHYTNNSRIIIQWWGDWLHNNVAGDTMTITARTGTDSVATNGTVMAIATQSTSNQIGATRSAVGGWIQIAFGASYEFTANGYIVGRRPTGGTNNDGSFFVTGPSGLSSAPWTAGGTDTHLKITGTWSAASANDSYTMDGYRAWWVKG